MDRLASFPLVGLPDPWDRLIVATAIKLPLPLVTRGPSLRNTGAVQTICNGCRAGISGRAVRPPKPIAPRRASPPATRTQGRMLAVHHGPGAAGVTIDEFESQLVVPAAAPPFSGIELKDEHEPVRRFFHQAVAEGTPAAVSVRLRMRGHIKIGRWIPFRARQVLAPHRGLLWSARAAGVIAGWDRYFDGAGAMRWKLGGLFTVAQAEGPDVLTSAAGRAAGEAIWLPTALLPRYGVEWSALDTNRIEYRYTLDNVPLRVQYEVDASGRIHSLVFDRWGDPDNSGPHWRTCSFGGEVTEYGTYGGLSIPTAGRVGWRFGTDQWPDGEFFRFRITGLELLGL